MTTTATPQIEGARIDNESVALRFILAGKANFTLVSTKTSKRFTYKVNLVHCNKCKRDWSGRKEQSCEGCPCHAELGERRWFVSVLTGPNNETDYAYAGVLRVGSDGVEFNPTYRSQISNDAQSIMSLVWTLAHLRRNATGGQVEIWHVGFCGRCGRRLTVPSSIASGFGPECIGKVGA
jgi:hypothetical protein